MTVAKKKPAKNATKLTNVRTIWCELANLAPETVSALVQLAIATSQVQSRFWDIWSDHHRGNNSEIILRECHEARQRGEDVRDEIDACPTELWGYLQKATAEEFTGVHGRVIALLSNRFIKNLNTKVPVMGNLQTWRCVLLGAVDRPYHVGLGIIPFDAKNSRFERRGDKLILSARVVRGQPPLELVIKTPRTDRYDSIREMADGKTALRGGWLYRGKFGRWCVAWPQSGKFAGRKKSRRYAARTAVVRGAADAALVIECGDKVWRLTSQLGQVRHIRRLVAEQLAGRRYGLGGTGRIGHGRKRRRRAELPWTDGKWQRLCDRVNDQLAYDVAAATGRMGAGKVVYEGGCTDAALVTIGVTDAVPHSFRGWQWHDLGTKIGQKTALEGAEFDRRDGYFSEELGGKSKPRKKKRAVALEVAGK